MPKAGLQKGLSRGKGDDRGEWGRVPTSIASSPPSPGGRGGPYTDFTQALRNPH